MLLTTNYFQIVIIIMVVHVPKKILDLASYIAICSLFYGKEVL